MSKQETSKKGTSKSSKIILFVLSAIVFVCAVVFVATKTDMVSSFMESHFKQESITEESQTPDFSDIQSGIQDICELATLKCYYHDVTEYERKPSGISKYVPFKYGYKKMFIEYGGIVTAGIDASKVQVNLLDDGKTVQIYVPGAEILDVDADKSSMSVPIEQTGVFTEITTQEKLNAFSSAQSEMEKKAAADSTILSQAHSNAKKLIKQYITRIGEQMGHKYVVEWADSPSEIK